MTLILEKIRQREWELIGSEILVYEIEQTVNAERKERLLLLAREASRTVEITGKILDRAETLSTLGFDNYDALHLASAESAKVDAFLSTDDQLQKIAVKTKNDFL